MIKIKVIGCGSAFSDKLFNTSFLITNDENKTLLIDYGYNIPQALKYHNISRVDNIYISHLHADHCGGLERIAFQNYDWVKKPKNGFDNQINLYCNEMLMDDLWNKTLRGGLESMEGFQANLNTFFKTNKIQPNDYFMFGNNKCTPVQQVHIMSGNIIVPSFGLMIETKEGKKAYFVTDSQYDSPKQNKIYYNQSDIIFQDCECFVNPEDEQIYFTSGVHASYGELAGWKSANSTVLTKEIRNKMWLCHYADFVAENKDFYNNCVDWENCAAKDGFCGFVKLGQEITL